MAELLLFTKACRWFDIEYSFSWRTTWNEWIDQDGTQKPAAWLGWNKFFAGPFSSWKNLKLNPWPMAWYDGAFNAGSGFVWGLVLGNWRRPYTTVEVAYKNGPNAALNGKNFSALFDLASP